MKASREEVGAALRWGAAGAMVAALHVAAGWWLVTHPLAAEAPAAVQGIPIDLEPVGAAPPPAAQAPEPAATPPAPTPAEPPAALPPPSEMPPDPPDTTAAAEPPQPEPAPPPSVEQPPPELPPAPELAAPPEATPPKPTPEKPKEEAVLAPPPPPRPDPREVAREAARRRAAADKREQQRQARAAAAQARAAARATETRATDSTASAPVDPGSGASVATWRGAVLAHLNAFRPPATGASGTAVVSFAVDGGGRVLSAGLASSSGDAALDAAAVGMVRRASPVPAPPPNLGRRVQLSVPVRAR